MLWNCQYDENQYLFDTKNSTDMQKKYAKLFLNFVFFSAMIALIGSNSPDGQYSSVVFGSILISQKEETPVSWHVQGITIKSNSKNPVGLEVHGNGHSVFGMVVDNVRNGGDDVGVSIRGNDNTFNSSTISNTWTGLIIHGNGNRVRSISLNGKYIL
jgi:hypothetical protein